MRNADKIMFDAHFSLSKEWKKEFPNGKFPDRIGYLLSEVRREYWCLLSQYKKGYDNLTVPKGVQTMEVRYITDDRDEKRRNELVIQFGGNGDWYVAVVPEGTGAMGKAVRISTSGGAASACPGLPSAIADAFRAIKRANNKNMEKPPLDAVDENDSQAVNGFLGSGE